MLDGLIHHFQVGEFIYIINEQTIDHAGIVRAGQPAGNLN